MGKNRTAARKKDKPGRPVKKRGASGASSGLKLTIPARSTAATPPPQDANTAANVSPASDNQVDVTAHLSLPLRQDSNQSDSDDNLPATIIPPEDKEPAKKSKDGKRGHSDVAYDNLGDNPGESGSEDGTATLSPKLRRPKAAHKGPSPFSGDESEKPESKPQPDWELKLVLLIPEASRGGGNKRKTVLLSLSYEDALEMIYEVVGCADIRKKPALQYKLSSTPQKEKPISLTSDDDWEGLIEDVKSAQAKKKSVVPMNIIVSDQYAASLRNALKEGKSSQRASSTGTKKSNKLPLLDLNNSGDEEDDGDDGGLAEKEKKMYETLQRSLTRCQKCGPEKFCKISRDGTHVNLSFQQRRGWAIALATQTRGVTLTTPPKSELFSMFSGEPTSTPASATATPSTPTMMNPMMIPYPMVPPWAFGMAPGQFPTPTAVPPTPTAGSSQRNDFPSSDPPDMGDATQYPEIDTFLQALSEKHPRRGLDLYILRFEQQDYYNIDEILKIPEDRLTSEDFGMTPGNAQFLINAIRVEVKRIDRTNGKKTSRL